MKQLVDITLYISDMRENIKLQIQKNHMKGTFNYLSYIINEYLVGFANSSTELTSKTVLDAFRNHIRSDIKITEYYDTTEYFNLSTDNTPNANNRKLVNERYWEDTERTVNTNSGFAFAKDEIEKFYMETMNMKNSTSDLMNFLKTVYESGANRSYVSKDTNKPVISTRDELSSDSKDMFERFYGEDNYGKEPYRNIKNSTHASYQVHPYLFNFIEAANYQFPVENAFYNNINQELEDADTLKKLNQLIGEYGQVINVAMNNQYDYSGYKSKYETSTHESVINSRGKKYRSIDYDGAFYPDAVNEFLENPDKIIKDIRNLSGDFYKQYYYPLNLNQSQINFICDQLEEHYKQIKDKAETKAQKNEVWDIYKYGRDAYENAYILYKKYKSDNPTEKEKLNTKGELWIRLKDHPIAFPAFQGTHPQIDTRVDYYNNLLDNILSGNGKIGQATKDNCQYFYDLEFDNTRQILFMPYYPVYAMPELSSEKFAYNTCDSASIIACNITEEFIEEENFNKIQLNSNREDNDKIDGYKNTKMAKLGKEGYTFTGFTKNGTQTNAVFIRKSYVREEKSENHYELPSENTINANIITFNKLDSITSYEVQLPTNYGSVELKFKNPEIRLGYYDDIMVFAIPVTLEDNVYRNYIGKADYNASETKSETYGQIDLNES